MIEKNSGVNFKVLVRCYTFNHASFITDAMNGFCMQQTDFPFICTIVDDASIDGEQDVMNKYVNENFDLEDTNIVRNEKTNDYVMTFARHRTNPNCYFATYFLKYNHRSIHKAKINYLNKWTEHVDYISICEGDDYWTDPLKLQKQVDFLENHSDCILCSHDFKVYSENSKSFIFNSSYRYYNLPITISLDNFFDGDWIQTLTIMYRNCLHYSVIPREKYKHYRDRIFHYYLLKNGIGCLLPDVMGVYRKHYRGVLSGRKAEDNYYIYISIALDIYHIENEPRALRLLRRHALGLFNYRWNHCQRKDLISDFRYLLTNAPFRTTLGLLVSFIKSLIKNKLSF